MKTLTRAPAQTAPRVERRNGVPFVFAIPVMLVVYAIGQAYVGRAKGAYDVIGAYVVFIGLLLISLPIVIAIGRRDPDPRILRVVKWALFLKLLGGVFRYLVVSELYSGFGDSALYHRAGLQLSALFRDGVYHADIGPVIGTGFIDIVTGVVYTLIGPTKIGGFIFFSWLGFWGLLLFYRAFCIGIPNGDRFRYALLIFFMPSMIFWPSATGKDAWMMFALGLCAYGVARIHVRRWGGFIVLALGLLASVMARPHVAAIVMVALTASYLFRRSPQRQSPVGPVAKVIGIVVLVALTGLVLRQAESYLNVDSLTNQETITELQDYTRKQTTTGFSKFETPEKGGASSLPLGIVTLLFRPFPWEATSGQSLFASLEGVLLIALFVRGRRRLKSLFRVARDHAPVVFALVYAPIFIYAFSAVGNFAIVGRQRAQLYPFIFVLLALPAAARVKRRSTGPRSLVATPPGRQLHR
jgi:hypothetical protein